MSEKNPAVLKVLVVDDFELIRKIHVKNLTKMGFTEIDQCQNGQEALEAIERTKYDLILMDMYMPVLNGQETLKAIRDKGLKMPVVLCTDEADTAFFKTMSDLGANACITKPYAPDHFSQVIKDALKK